MLAFDGKTKALQKQVEDTRTFIKEIGKVQHDSASKAEAQARDSLDRRMAELQVQILEAQVAGDSTRVKTLEAKFGADEEQFRSLERALRGKEEKADPLRRKWLDRLRTLTSQLYALEREEADAEHTRQAEADKVRQSLAHLAAIDEQLVELAARLSALDFTIGKVTVSAAGSHVFEATAGGSQLAVAAIENEIAATRQVLAELEERRQEAKQQYLAQAKEIRDALNHVSETIMSVAYKKAGVDFVYNLWDVAKAARNGGLVGAGAETLRKLGETLIKEYVLEKGPGTYGSAGATEFDNDLSAEIRLSLDVKKTQKTAIERTVKETVTKPIRDKVSQTYGVKLFNKLYGDLPAIPPGAQAAPNAPAGAVAKTRAWLGGFRDHQAHLKKLKEGFKKPWSSLKNTKGFTSDLVGASSRTRARTWPRPTSTSRSRRRGPPTSQPRRQAT